MKKRMSAICCMLSALALTAALSLPVLAKTPFYLSKNDAKVGETVTLTFNSDDLSTVVVRFDPAYFTVKGGTEGYTVSGSNVTINAKSGQVTFEAKQSGTTYFAVANSSGVDQGSTKYTVSGEAASAQTPAATDNSQTPAATDNSQTPAQTSQYEADYTIDGVQYTLSERFTDAEIPAGYSVARQQIHGYNYKVLKGPGSDVLVYVKHTDNIAGSGVFWHYHADSDTITPMVLIGDTKNYVMVTDAPSMPASNPTPTTAEIKGASVAAYTIAGQDGVFFYGRSSDGSEGWYQCDPGSGYYVRADETVINTPPETPAEETPAEETPAEETPAETEPETPAEETPAEERTGLFAKLKSIDPRYLLIGLIAAIAVVLIAVVNIVLRNREREDEDEDDLEYDFGRIRLDDADAASYRARMAKINAEDDEEYYQDGMSKYLDDSETDDEPVLPQGIKKAAEPARPKRDDRWDYGKLESEPEEDDEEGWDPEIEEEEEEIPAAPAEETPQEDLSETRVFELPPSLNNLFSADNLHRPGEEEDPQIPADEPLDAALEDMTGIVAHSVGEMAQTAPEPEQPAEEAYAEESYDEEAYDEDAYDEEAYDADEEYDEGEWTYEEADDGAYVEEASDAEAYGEAEEAFDGGIPAEEDAGAAAHEEAVELRRAREEAIANEEAPSFTLIDFNDL